MLFANLTDNAKITEMYNKTQQKNDMEKYFILLIAVIKTETSKKNKIPDRIQGSIRHVIIKFYISF